MAAEDACPQWESLTLPLADFISSSVVLLGNWELHAIRAAQLGLMLSLKEGDGEAQTLKKPLGRSFFEDLCVLSIEVLLSDSS
jgi:hypothetical protein